MNSVLFQSKIGMKKETYFIEVKKKRKILKIPDIDLLIPVCLSASHIAYGFIPMEPVFILLRKSAAVARYLVGDKKCIVH